MVLLCYSSGCVSSGASAASFSSFASFVSFFATMASEYLSLGEPGRYRAVVFRGVTSPSVIKSKEKTWKSDMYV